VGLIDATQLTLEQAMSGAAARQQVLANNIANASTPNFKRSDLDFESQLNTALQNGPGGLNSLTYSSETDTTSPVQSNGNNVDIDTEMSDMSQNALDYETLVEVASARLKMLQTAMGTSGS
jgi:flagellar basal-body rod protein FlgB